MTLILNCNRHITKPLRRSVGVQLPTDGLIFTGIQMDDDADGADEMFIGDLQMLLIADRPDEAFFLCTKYSPNCPGTVSMGGLGLVHATGSSFESAEQQASSTARSVNQSRSNKTRSRSRTSSSRSKSTLKKIKQSAVEHSEEDDLVEGRWGGRRGGNILLDMEHTEGHINVGQQENEATSQSDSNRYRSSGTVSSGSSSIHFNETSTTNSRASESGRSSGVNIANSSRNSNKIGESNRREVDTADALYDYMDYGSENELDQTDEKYDLNNTVVRGNDEVL